MKKNILAVSFILLFLFAYSNIIAGGLEVIKEKTFPISPGKQLKIDASSGDVKVTSWDKNEVYIKILGNDKAKDMKFKFYNDEDKVEVIAKRDNWFFDWFSSGARLRFEIKVPVKFNEKIRTSGGNLYTSNTSGNFDFSTSGGDIQFENVKGTFNLSTSGGDITGINFEGDLDVSTSGGNIDLAGTNSKISASTSGGNIFLDYKGNNNGIDLSTSGGNIQIKLPEDFNASAQMHTSGGEISCELTANNAKKISSTKFVADLNKGGNKLYAETSGGDITILKK